MQGFANLRDSFEEDYVRPHLVIKLGWIHSYPSFFADILSHRHFRHFSRSNSFHSLIKLTTCQIDISRKRTRMCVHHVHIRDSWHIASFFHVKVSFIGFVAGQKSRKNFWRYIRFMVSISKRTWWNDEKQWNIYTNNNNNNF